MVVDTLVRNNKDDKNNAREAGQGRETASIRTSEKSISMHSGRDGDSDSHSHNVARWPPGTPVVPNLRGYATKHRTLQRHLQGHTFRNYHVQQKIHESRDWCSASVYIWNAYESSTPKQKYDSGVLVSAETNLPKSKACRQADVPAVRATPASLGTSPTNTCRQARTYHTDQDTNQEAIKTRPGGKKKWGMQLS